MTTYCLYIQKERTERRQESVILLGRERASELQMGKMKPGRALSLVPSGLEHGSSSPPLSSKIEKCWRGYGGVVLGSTAYISHPLVPTLKPTNKLAKLGLTTS